MVKIERGDGEIALTFLVDMNRVSATWDGDLDFSRRVRYTAGEGMTGPPNDIPIKRYDDARICV